MGEKEYLELLSDDGAVRLRVKLLTRKGKIVEFTIQLEAFIGNTWLPVVRYDNAHGFAHKDELTLKGELVRKQPVKLELPQVDNF